jgi:hypothetical protein
MEIEIEIEIGHRLVMLFVAPNSYQHCVGGIDGEESDMPKDRSGGWMEK